jgi:hypothetical protein
MADVLRIDLGDAASDEISASEVRCRQEDFKAKRLSRADGCDLS